MNIKNYLLVFLILIIASVGVAIYKFSDRNLHLVVCDVGQGDAILVLYKSSEILIDGGPNNKVLDCLGKYMPFWDRTIEMVILTHPDTDHFRGLVEVFKRYNVGIFLANPLETGNQEYGVLENIVRGRGVKVVNPTSGTKTRLGLIYLDVLWPSEDFFLANTEKLSDRNSAEKIGVYTTKLKVNEFSITTKLNFSKFNALLTGDIPKENFSNLLTTIPINSVEYIKVPHHGSKAGLDEEILGKTRPGVAVISVGLSNTYGHPAKETLDLLKNFNVKVFRTDTGGDIELVTNGRSYWVKN